MKIRNLFILIILIGYGCGNAKFSPAENGLPNDSIVTVKQQGLIYEHLKLFPDKTQVSFAIIKNDSVRYYGVIRKHDTLFYKKNYQNVFEIGSISKVFTSTLLANFVIHKKVNLNDKINDYLEIPLKDNIQISFKQLANHTSGLPRIPSNFIITSLFNMRNPYKNYDEKKLEKYLTKKMSLTYPQGKESRYSNLGAGLLGYTLCKISGESYEELLKKYIFSKYQMENSTTNREKVSDRLVKGLNKRGKETPNWDMSAMVAAGGILSNVEDLSKFAMAQFDESNKELVLTREKTFIDSTGLDIGLGWHIVRTKQGDELYWHNGGTGGYRSSMALDIKRENAIIMLSNVSASNTKAGKIDGLCFALIKTLNKNYI